MGLGLLFYILLGFRYSPNKCSSFSIRTWQEGTHTFQNLFLCRQWYILLCLRVLGERLCRVGLTKNMVSYCLVSSNPEKATTMTLTRPLNLKPQTPESYAGGMNQDDSLTQPGGVQNPDSEARRNLEACLLGPGNHLQVYTPIYSISRHTACSFTGPLNVYRLVVRL